MKKISGKLIEYGMDFEYENNGSKGEEITCHRLGIKVAFQQGKIYFEENGELKEFSQALKYVDYCCELIENACIQETT